MSWVLPKLVVCFLLKSFQVINKENRCASEIFYRKKHVSKVYWYNPIRYIYLLNISNRYIRAFIRTEKIYLFKRIIYVCTTQLFGNTFTSNRYLFFFSLYILTGELGILIFNSRMLFAKISKLSNIELLNKYKFVQTRNQTPIYFEVILILVFLNSSYRSLASIYKYWNLYQYLFILFLIFISRIRTKFLKLASVKWIHCTHSQNQYNGFAYKYYMFLTSTPCSFSGYIQCVIFIDIFTLETRIKTWMSNLTRIEYVLCLIPSLAASNFTGNEAAGMFERTSLQTPANRRFAWAWFKECNNRDNGIDVGLRTTKIRKVAERTRCM